jgi:hypothetical protein
LKLGNEEGSGRRENGEGRRGKADYFTGGNGGNGEAKKAGRREIDKS